MKTILSATLLAIAALSASAATDASFTYAPVEKQTSLTVDVTNAPFSFYVYNWPGTLETTAFFTGVYCFGDCDAFSFSSLDGNGFYNTISSTKDGVYSADFWLGYADAFDMNDRSTTSFVNVLAFTSAVPEPEPVALLAAGLLAAGFVARRRKQRV